MSLSHCQMSFNIHVNCTSVATKNHRIQSFSRHFLDPRRPNRKTTTEEQEEYLITYDPVLPNDSKRVLSHNYNVRKNFFFLQPVSKIGPLCLTGGQDSENSNRSSAPRIDLPGPDLWTGHVPHARGTIKHFRRP